MIQGGSSGGHAEMRHKHRDMAGGWLRPAVSGAVAGALMPGHGSLPGAGGQ
ncbi:hypothetical protein GCM10022226_28860 [Sphaerisporangium flaviroseum]|uniref:Uncharacterized protein n=1 Tax=Sphaerisporangium flaviroseum TaxID=509199 RepID=A0ABP7HYV3_9ACTN